MEVINGVEILDKIALTKEMFVWGVPQIVLLCIIILADAASYENIGISQGKG